MKNVKKDTIFLLSFECAACQSQSTNRQKSTEASFGFSSPRFAPNSDGYNWGIERAKQQKKISTNFLAAAAAGFRLLLALVTLLRIYTPPSLTVRMHFCPPKPDFFQQAACKGMDGDRRSISQTGFFLKKYVSNPVMSMLPCVPCQCDSPWTHAR